MDFEPVRLRTLACFFPKFSYDDDADENTSAASTAQTTMREALESGDYQVRISPKHSGSLALWHSLTRKERRDEGTKGLGGLGRREESL